MRLDHGRTKPCREYERCRHRKHGYTRKDHPAPDPLRFKVKAKHDYSGLVHVCWCNVKQKAAAS